MKRSAGFALPVFVRRNEVRRFPVQRSRCFAAPVCAALLVAFMSTGLHARVMLPASAEGDTTVHVAPPVGEHAADRASILAALERVRPGGTVQFAAGTYIVGEMIRVTTPGVTLLAHPEGTTLQGCREGLVDPDRDAERCNGLELAGARQTVRGFTIQDVFWGIHLGCCWGEKTTYTRVDGSSFDGPAFYRTAGGHLVEGNTIIRAASGIRVNGDWSEPAVVRGNRFVDNWHAVSINGHTVHLLDNEITVLEPERVPFWGFPWDGVKISPTPPLRGLADEEPRTCVGNVVVGNRIEGHLDGIRIELYLPGTRCTGNIIRDNTIAVQRVKNPRPGNGFTLVDESDSTFVGVPISLLNEPVAFGEAEPDGETTIEGNVIEGNRILGGEGVGIQVLHASRNRIAGNTVRGIIVRDPFPGNTMGRRGAEGAPLPWERANGAGIWVSPGSDGNLLEGNVFEGVAHASVVLEGEVETDDGVRLYYRVEGEGPDTVVVIHGGPSLGLAYLAPDLVPLARGRAVVHYDQRGIGRSTPLTDPARLSIQRHVQDLEALRTHLGLERLALLGHSWGGMLAARYAAAHPQRVERILLLDPMPPARDPFMAMAGARAQEMFRARLDETARARLDSLAATAEVADPGALCRERFSLLTRFFFEDPTVATRSRADFCAGSPETVRNREEVDAAIFGSLGAWDVRSDLGHVRSPVLVVRGAAGAIPREAMEAWVEAFPNARLITIERAGHYLHVDRPEVFFPAAEIFFGGGWPETEAVAPDTTRYTAMPGGIPRGERLVWLEEPNTLRYAMLFGPPGAPNRPRLESTVGLDAEGIPVRIEVRGFQPHGAPWEERFELRGDTAVWSTPAEQRSTVIAGPAYYPSLLAGPMYHPWPAFGAYDLGLLARALLRRPDRSLPLLPDGEARLEVVERRVVEITRRTRTVTLYAIHGLDFAPAYVWLDESGAFFADGVSVAAGWEPVYRELAQASTAAHVEHARERLASSIVPPRERPLVIRGARLFDPATRSVRDGTTIVVEGRRITAVGADGSVAAPRGSEVIDAVGRMVLPGLWDMHVHFQPGWSDELSAPLFIAAGVTTTRDLGGDTDLVVSLRQRTETGEAVGPRILPALIMYGPGQHPLGAGVGTVEEARQAVDRFAALGYVQVKLYNPVPAELVPVIIERARHHGMRVSGHIPNGMTGKEAIEGGFDELQHLLYARVAAAGIRNLATDSAVGARLAAVQVGSDEWERFVRLLRARGTVIDATLAVVEESVGRNPAAWLTPVLDRFPAQAARIASRTAGPSAPPPMLRELWTEIVANGPGLVRALHEAGVPLVLGTDAPIGGFELHRELELFVRAGIPAPDVLHLATLGAARVMGMDDDLGSIETGKLADLILVDGDPAADIRDIRRVMTVVKDGRVYDPAAIYEALGLRP